jgi:hypothetical protein
MICSTDFASPVKRGESLKFWSHARTEVKAEVARRKTKGDARISDSLSDSVATRPFIRRAYTAGAVAFLIREDDLL